MKKRSISLLRNENWRSNEEAAFACLTCSHQHRRRIKISGISSCFYLPYSQNSFHSIFIILLFPFFFLSILFYFQIHTFHKVQHYSSFQFFFFLQIVRITTDERMKSNTQKNWASVSKKNKNQKKKKERRMEEKIWRKHREQEMMTSHKHTKFE